MHMSVPRARAQNLWERWMSARRAVRKNWATNLRKLEFTIQLSTDRRPVKLTPPCYLTNFLKKKIEKYTGALNLHPAPAGSGLTDFTENLTVILPSKMNKSKKFRFDSFATEFSEENIKKEQVEFPDNDSGIGEFDLIF